MKLSEKPQIAQRIIAARTLKAWEQSDLMANLGEHALLTKDLARKLEGVGGEREWRKAGIERQRAVASILDVPLRWLTEPDVRVIQRLGGQATSANIEEKAAAVLAQLTQLDSAVRALRKLEVSDNEKGHP